MELRPLRTSERNWPNKDVHQGRINRHFVPAKARFVPNTVKRLILYVPQLLHVGTQGRRCLSTEYFSGDRFNQDLTKMPCKDDELTREFTYTNLLYNIHLCKA